MNQLKYFFFYAVVILCSTLASAQDRGTFGFGLSGLYATEIDGPGVGLKGQYNITDHVRTELGFDYFFGNHDRYLWEINANVHYTMPITPNFYLYPIAGINVTRYGLKDQFTGMLTGIDYTETKFGGNVGAGFEYKVAPNFSLQLEGK